MAKKPIDFHISKTEDEGRLCISPLTAEAHNFAKGSEDTFKSVEFETVICFLRIFTRLGFSFEYISR